MSSFMDDMDVIRDALKTIHEKESMDSGGGLSSYDFWVMVGGVEYVVSVQRSGKPSKEEVAGQH